MVYIVEDDDNIRHLVEYTLNSTGIPAKGFALPSELWASLKTETPDLIMLDIMLPEENGLSILEKLRAKGEYSELPIVFLTAKGTEYDKVLGFEKGADDYIPKPFGMMEMVARIKALLRRSKRSDKCDFASGALTVNKDEHTVKVNDVPVSLTNKEFELLLCLIRNEGIVLTRDRLLDDIWGYSFDGESRTVDVHVRTLRKKLGPCGSMIETVRSVGYKFTK